LDDVTWLMSWYLSQCDGDWEHGYGIRIDTLDNPGWRLRVNLEGTPLEGRDLAAVSYNLESDDDWWHAQTREGWFEAACSPLNLVKIVRLFRGFARQ